ncbi:MAG: hypothetical protein A3G36_03980 [Omnitrophica bacterium RIFCSPLOWO2_12_FULL_45_13]|nr:MAG: hypothetical protein A3G36_03980 [Omnitrophica bacterium RIFCSPLOWO2_12_FULL_45_13]
MNKLISIGRIESKIFHVRGKKVMLDKDLAELYDVPTKQLTRQVRRNSERFPDDFMFKLTKDDILRCQIGTSRYGGRRYPPYVFTQEGVAMLSSVLNSRRAILVNIQIMSAFVSLRRVALTYAGLRRKIDDMEKKYDGRFAIVFQVIRKLLETSSVKSRRITGFKPI